MSQGSIELTRLQRLDQNLFSHTNWVASCYNMVNHLQLCNCKGRSEIIFWTRKGHPISCLWGCVQPLITKKPLDYRPPYFFDCCQINGSWYACHIVLLMWHFDHSWACTVVADGLAPIWCQDICSHNGNIGQSEYIWSPQRYVYNGVINRNRCGKFIWCL